jgi:hypothetical protein
LQPALTPAHLYPIVEIALPSSFQPDGGSRIIIVVENTWVGGQHAEVHTIVQE